MTPQCILTKSRLICRLPVVIKYNVRIPAGINKEELNQLIPRPQQWPADNFAHLHESPTLFYVTALSLAFLGISDRFAVTLAWLYVAVRILHSLIQATTNIIVYRFSVYVTSQFILFGMVARVTLFLVGIM